MTAFALKDLSSNTLSVLIVKYKQILLGRIVYLALGVLVYCFWTQISGLNILFILFYIGLIGIFISIKKPFGLIHNISLPIFFTPYLALPVAVSKTGTLFVFLGLSFAGYLFIKNKKRLNFWVQIALLAPATIFILLTVLY